MSHMCTLSNKALVADVLHSCFGQGDFKVVVEEVFEDGTKRTEFPVWSLLLRKWSDVFANMMRHQQFIEGSTAEVVIQDFSACAVDAFLRFLYSGTLSTNLSTLIEVGVIADKYQVQPLYKACMGTVKEKLASETACEIFECADRFHLEELRRKAKEEILIEPRDALPRRSSLSSKLLDEVLSSELLCIEEWELLELFLEWGSAEDMDAVLQLIAKHVDLRGIPEDDFQQLCADSRTRGQKAVLLRMREKQPQEQRFKRSQHCTDMLSALYLRHIEEGHERLPFLGYWVNVIPGDLSQEWLNSGIEHMQHIARNGSFLNLEDGWIAWFLPHTPFYLLGFSFETFMPTDVHFELSCSRDGKDWHVAMVSEGNIPAGDLTPSNYYPHMVQWIKLKVTHGLFHNDLQIHGIVRS